MQPVLKNIAAADVMHALMNLAKKMVKSFVQGRTGSIPAHLTKAQVRGCVVARL